MRRAWLMLLLCVSAQLVAYPASKEKLRFEEIEVILGSMAKLPCDLVPPEDNDSVALVIWYKDDDKTPIYSMDVRERDLHKGIHWADGDLEGRAQFSSDLYQAALTLVNSKGSDTGLYKCRVDFKHSPTRNSFVNVTVIVPPEDIHLEDSEGNLITSRTLGPLPEGTPLQLTCVSAGGMPTPRVSWWYNLTLLDDSYDVLRDGRVQNSLSLDKTEREHLHGVLTCQALNSPFVVPKSTSVSIDLYLGPLDVRLLGDNLPVGAGSEYEVACQTSGSRPPATLTWWKSGVPLHLPAREVSSIEGNVTTSTVRLRPGKSDHGAKLSCRATNPRVPNKALEASWTLDVHFVPETEVVLVSSDNSSVVKEGMTIALQCRVQANPPVDRVKWFHNMNCNVQIIFPRALFSAFTEVKIGQLNYHDNLFQGNPVQNGMDYQVSANNSLTILFVTRKSSGEYSCWTLNSEGESRSPPFLLDVKYSPKCLDTEPRLYGTSYAVPADVTCETTGNPQARKFWWRYKTSVADKDEFFSTNGSAGVGITKVSMTGSEGEVSLFCWGENDVGNQSIPCSFRVVLANNPEAPSNCSLADRGETWVAVLCLAGSDGGLPQTFLAEVTLDGRLVANASRSGTAEFTVTGLEPGATYGVTVSAINQKGHSETVTFPVATAGKLLTQRRTTTSDFSSNKIDSSLLLGFVSFLSCILAIGAILGAVMLLKRLQKPSPQSSPEQKKVEEITVAETCTLSDDDRNPDVVPYSNEITVLEVKGDISLNDALMWDSKLVLSSVPIQLANTQTVPCMQTWDVVGWEGSCPNIAQRHAETQTPQNVLESVV